MKDEVDGGLIGKVEGGGVGCRIKWRVALIEDKCEKIKTRQQQIFFLLQQPQFLAVAAVKDLLSSCEVCASRSQPICKTSETINPPPSCGPFTRRKEHVWTGRFLQHKPHKAEQDSGASKRFLGDDKRK